MQTNRCTQETNAESGAFGPKHPPPAAIGSRDFSSDNNGELYIRRRLCRMSESYFIPLAIKPTTHIWPLSVPFTPELHHPRPLSARALASAT